MLSANTVSIDSIYGGEAQLDRIGSDQFKSLVLLPCPLEQVFCLSFRLKKRTNFTVQFTHWHIYMDTHMTFRKYTKSCVNNTPRAIYKYVYII